MVPRPRPRSRSSGVSSVQVIVVLPSILMLSWLAIEVGMALRSAGAARTGADSIALAGAARFDDGFRAAVADAQLAAASNRGPSGPLSVTVGPGPAGGGDLEFGRWDATARAFVPDIDGGRACRATVRFGADHPNGAPGLLLSQFFPDTAVAFQRQSVAIYMPPKHITSALLLGEGSEALEVERAAQLRATGAVTVLSSDPLAVRIAGAPRVLPAELRIVGGIDPEGLPLVEADVATGYPAPADPYLGQALPPLDLVAPAPIDHGNAGITLVQPGVHAGLQATGGRVVLLPGLHQFMGPIVMSGDAELELQLASLLLGPDSRFNLTGRARIFGSPSGAVPEWADFGVLQESGDRNWSVRESAEVDIDGHVYAPTSNLRVEDEGRWLGRTLIVSTARLRGDSFLRLRGSILPIEGTPVPGRARLVR